MEQNAFQQAVIAAAQQLGLADYELYFQFADGISVDIFGRDEIKEFSSATEGGVCFRCIVDGKMGYASTQLLSEASAADIVRRAVDNAKTLEKDDPVFLGEGGQSYPDCPEEQEILPEGAIPQRHCDHRGAARVLRRSEAETRFALRPGEGWLLGEERRVVG